MSKLTQEELKELLNYDPLTGVFVWKNIDSNRVKVGDIAGHKESNGYIRIKIMGKNYLAHRLAWLYVHGYLPEYIMDHRNRIRDNNWILNLREASQQCNMRNRKSNANNSSGVKGVCYDKHANKWKAQIQINRKTKNLGIYIDFQDAVCARLAGEQCVSWSGCDTNSPAYQYVKENIRGL